MDLNELLHVHQVSVMQASAANDEEARDGHFAKVAEYAERIRQLRHMHQPRELPAKMGEPETIIYGTYTGPAALPLAPRPVDDWEGEGGALDPPEVVTPDGAAPEGVTTKHLRLYHVGPYVYHDLDLAVAEHMRQLSAGGDDRET